MYQLADTDKAFIYELNSEGINKWNAHVQPGYGDDGERFPKEEREKVARLMACAPDLLRALELARSSLVLVWYELCSDKVTDADEAFIHQIDVAIAKAKGNRDE